MNSWGPDVFCNFILLLVGLVYFSNKDILHVSGCVQFKNDRRVGVWGEILLKTNLDRWNNTKEFQSKRHMKWLQQNFPHFWISQIHECWLTCIWNPIITFHHHRLNIGRAIGTVCDLRRFWHWIYSFFLRTQSKHRYYVFR